MAKSSTRRSAAGKGMSAPLKKYLDQSQRPIVILAYLLPAAIIYQIGSRVFGRSVVAPDLLSDMMAYLGVYGPSVPAVLLALTLLSWHLVSRDRWQFSLRTLGGMILESVLLAIPILAIGVLTRHFTPLWASGSVHIGARLSQALGAGVYEELVFRLYLCALLWLLFAKALAVPKLWAGVLVVTVSAVLFSAYHYLGNESFAWGRFIFRILAGAYLAVLYMTRGLGITAGAHAVYNIAVLLFAAR